MLTTRVERLLQLIQMLQTGRALSADELAASVGVSRRTVFRDLKVLSRAGIPFEFDRSSRRYSANRSALLPPVSLTPAEALCVLLATRTISTSPLAWDKPTAAAAAIKIESMLPPLLREHCGPLMEKTAHRPVPSCDAASIDSALAIIQSALAERTTITMKYDSPYDGGIIDVALSPYRLAFIHRAWYVIGYSRLHDATRTFKVERVIQLRQSDEPFYPDPLFNLDDYFGNAWQMIRGPKRYHVKIRFSRKVGGNVDEVIWHKTQRCTYEPDRSLIFEVDVDGIQEISWWVLGYGAEAEVIEPAELRARIAGHIRTMTQTYRTEIEQNPKEE